MGTAFRADGPPAATLLRKGTYGPSHAWAVVLLVGIVSFALPAGASAEPLANLGGFGAPSGTDGGNLILAKGVAVNRSGAGAPEGSVYVAEANSNHRISQFNADGEFVRTWGFDVVRPGEENDNGLGFETCDVTNGNEATDCKAGVTGGAAGQLANPLGIAIDQSNGYLYVPSTTNRRVDVFSGSGEFAGAFGWGVDTGAAAPEVCTTDTTCQAAGTAGGDAGRFGALAVSNPAIDPNTPGRIYVPDPGNLRVAQYSTAVTGGTLTAATFDKAFGWDVIPGGTPALESCTSATTCQASQPTTGGTNPGQFTSGSPNAVAVDSTGAIYVTSGPTFGNCTAAAPCRIQKFSPDAGTATDFGPASGPGQLRFEDGAVNTVAPFNVAVNPANDHVFVQRRVSATSYQVLQYDSDGTYLDTHPSGDALSTASAANNAGGLAIGTANRVYANLGGTAAQVSQVFILGPVDPATVTIDPVSDVGTTTATFSGTVGIPAPGAPTFMTRYRFEYSENGVSWTSVPVPDGDVGDGSTGSHVVSQQVSGLDPNTLYAVRLVATTGPSVTSTSVNFTTHASGPRVEMTYVDQVTQSEAQLGAHVDPEGLDTTYRFEWGRAPCSVNPCARVPAFERQLGDGNKVLIAKEQITGLDPASAYHYRIIATNDTGTTTSPDDTFETLNHCNLTDNRCYELVSPAEKGPVGRGGDTATLGAEQQWQAAPGGSALQYIIAYGAADATAGEEVPYIAKRGGAGWSSYQLAPSTLGPSSEVSEGAKVFSNKGLSSDLSCGVFASSQALTDDAPDAALDMGGSLLYRRDIDHRWTVVTDSDPSNGQSEDIPRMDYFLVGMSDEPDAPCRRVVFQTRYAYPGAPGAGQRRLYFWEDGDLSYLGVIPGPDGPGCAGGACIVQAVAGAAANPDSSDVGTNNSERYDFWNAVSRDASRIAFTAVSKEGADAGRQAVFLREIGAPVAVDVSQSKTGVPNDDASNYQTSSDDGSKVFFLGRTGLANNDPALGPATCASPVNGAYQNVGAGCDLYMYSVGPDDAAGTADDTLEDLSELSAPGAAAANPAGAAVAGLLGISDDGAYVYFAARGQLVAGEGDTYAQNLARNTWSVYLAHDGDLAYVGRLGSGTEEARALFGADRGTGPTRVTSDGRHLLYVTGEDQGVGDNGGQKQAYIYDADARSLECVSCRRDLRPALEHQLSQNYGDPLTVSNWNTWRPAASLSEDGSRVFFVSRNALATGAVEGDLSLYQWEDGQISFIAQSAPNSTTQGLEFAGASANGNDLYFATVDRLTWQDGDGTMDVYDARVGGGFAEPPAAQPSCDPLSDGRCQPPGAAPSVVEAQTLAAAPEPSVEDPRAAISLGPLTQRMRRSLAAGRRVLLRLRVTGPGTIRLRGTARIGGFRAVVLQATSRAPKAGRYRVRVALSRPAVRRLSRRGRLALTLTVDLSGTQEGVVRRLMLRAPAGTTRHGNADRRTRR
jgi:hypothetical protein